MRDLARWAAVASVGLACAAVFPDAGAREARAPHASGLASRKGGAPAPIGPPAPMIATLVQTHTDERVPLDYAEPAPARFDALLADRVTGSIHELDPRLLGLLRTIAAKLAPPEGLPRVELVSGFRSPKLNEMLRKKGHHVASHSQHSLGHAVDFRIVVPCTIQGTVCLPGEEMGPLDPRLVEAAIRATGWDGGVGTYTGKDDRFVHADVGPRRAWGEGPRGAIAIAAR